jgi:DNA-binding transcriptional regulator YiaG
MKRHKLTSARVAELCGVQAQTVRCWRIGRYPTPSMAVDLLTYAFDK